MPYDRAFYRTSKVAAVICAVGVLVIGVAAYLGRPVPGGDTMMFVLLGTSLLVGANRMHGLPEAEHPAAGSSALVGLGCGLIVVAVAVFLIYTKAATFG